MKYALISPDEKIQPTGNMRVAQVELASFPVAWPLYWVACADTVTNNYTFDGANFVAPV